MKEKFKKVNILIMILLGLSSVLIGMGLQGTLNNNKIEEKEVESTPYGYLAYNTEKMRYLSDTPYIKEQSSVGWGSILLDKNASDDLINVNVDGKKTPFMKGVFAHATSTLVYDIKFYNYDYFTAYIGVDASRGNNGNGVKFAIYTSQDGTNWDLKTDVKSPVLKGTSNAIFVKIDIKDAKYLKLYCHNNGNDTADHAVYADAKFIKEDYVEDTSPVNFIKTVGEYDEILKSADFNTQLSVNELTILQRDFVNSVGYDILQSFVKYSEENKEAISWLMNDIENLRLYIVGGKPAGSYINSIKVLSELYKNYKADFNNKEVTKYGNVLGELYTKMAITLSLTHSAQVALWMQPSAPENQSDAVTRYAIYKQMHADGHFVASQNLDITQWFEEYSVEEMRFVLNNIIDDEEIIWLNEYTQKSIDAHPNEVWKYLTPHPYMKYIWPNYSKPEYHDEANKEMYSQKYGNFLDYGVSFRPGLYKLWMNLDNGAVCGGISKIGSNIRTVHGIPAAVIGQPGHAAIIYYTRDSQGKGYWAIDNDVSGWAQSEKGERMLLGWGNASYSKGSYQVVYMALAQEVLNNYETFEKSKEMVLLGQSYQGDLIKQEEIYRKALEFQPLNIDAWYELINVYNKNENKTEEDYYNLANELSEKLKYFPLPMYQLSNLIKPKLTSIVNSYRFTLLQTRILTEASVVPNNTADQYYVYQPSVTRTEANYLLGNLDSSIATFSFDGENAGKIVLSDRYDGNGIRWDYSLDGKKTWNEVSFTAEEEHKLQLTQKQIESITAENDIYIHIVGVSYDEENLYKIDIKESTGLPSNLFANDLENRVIGATNAMEWRFSENENWTSFKNGEPDLTGDKNVIVRVGKTGVFLASSSEELKYTKDIINEKRKYIPISHLSVHAVSSQATSNQGNAAFAIDGNYNTRWHSDWNGRDRDKYIIIKLDKPTVLSAMDYVPVGGGNGKILEASILGSMDGENYEEIGHPIWAKNDVIKTIDFDIPTEVQYIKIVGVKTSAASASLSFIGAKAFNFYEDTTKRELPKAEVDYDITTPTNMEVVAMLVNENRPLTITNNDGKNTYKFSENGSFTFEFVDEYGLKGEVTATVDWIDKTLPTASVKYSTTEKTKSEVIATLTDESEEIIITNNNGKNTYTFTENGTFEFIYKDKAGNINKTVATVDWIIKDDESDSPTNPDDEQTPPETPGEDSDTNEGDKDDNNPDTPSTPDDNEENSKPNPDDNSETEVDITQDNNTSNKTENVNNSTVINVPNTAFNAPIIIRILGLSILISGVGIIYTCVRKKYYR